MYVQGHVSCQNLCSHSVYLATQRHWGCTCGNTCLELSVRHVCFPTVAAPTALSALHHPGHGNIGRSHGGGRHRGHSGELRGEGNCWWGTRDTCLCNCLLYTQVKRCTMGAWLMCGFVRAEMISQLVSQCLSTERNRKLISRKQSQQIIDNDCGNWFDCF